MPFKINGKFTHPSQYKTVALCYKKLFLDEHDNLSPDGRVVLRDIISYSGLLKTDDNIKPTGRDVAIYISQTIFGKMDYYDALIKEYEESEKEEI